MEGGQAERGQGGSGGSLGSVLRVGWLRLFRRGVHARLFAMLPSAPGNNVSDAPALVKTTGCRNRFGFETTLPSVHVILQLPERGIKAPATGSAEPLTFQAANLTKQAGNITDESATRSGRRFIRERWLSHVMWRASRRSATGKHLTQVPNGLFWVRQYACMAGCRPDSSTLPTRETVS
jgi:hypothetical protein